MDDIRKWLNDRGNYADGCALYFRHGTNEILKRALAIEPESDFKRNKLRASLVEILSGPPAPVVTPHVVTKKYPESSPRWPDEPIENEVIRALHTAWKPLYLSMMNAQARVYEVALLGQTDTNKKLEAARMVHEILNTDDAIEEIYFRRDFYNEHGHLPGGVDESPVVGDPVRWATNLHNAERYVRDFKLKMKRNPANDKAAAKLVFWENEVVKYRKLLNLDV